ncbi:HET-domain-containing protein, partial [Cenococcum geophilum 1.58]|uniref:HET-domain-containing protein n=1 Tax=Cenococcum geophilum 1.58 TaxID=794803 RepID=UPI00358F8101
MTTADNLVKVEAAKKIYNSQPLDPSKQQIRLLSLFSSSSDDPLSGELRVISLQDGEKYSALSYVWGDEKFCPQMRLNGIDMTITSNLAIALRRLHSEGKARNIWIDAVCINQTDSAEKSHQVQMMKDIYANADLTLIWLGENADDSDLAMDLVSTISDEDFQQYTPEDPSWLALDPLFKRDWWTRMWIVQE